MLFRSVDRLLGVLAHMMQQKKLQLIQIGNTVFMLKPESKDVVEFHTFTIEPIDQLVLRYRAGINTVKSMGFKKAVSYSESPAFVKIAQQTGLPVHIKKEDGKKGPVYKFEVDL